MYGYIYKTTNKENNKIYIGQHKSEAFDPKYLGSGKNIRRAINKHGKSSFTVELIEPCDSRELLNERETYYIDLYNSRDESIGYNIAKGGQERFFTGCSHTNEAREKMREKALNRPHPPTTKGRIQITNGERNKVIHKEELEYYESIGWHRGRVAKKVIPWNKGLTKDDDPRLLKMSQDKKREIEENGPIGCYGVKGNTYGFVEGMTPWNKGLKGYNNGHPNYYHGKKK